MGSSEEKAMQVLQQNRAVQKPLIEKYTGRFIKVLGDGTMASFDKSTDAVLCAMAIQKASAEYSDLNLRIGIHHSILKWNRSCPKRAFALSCR